MTDEVAYMRANHAEAIGPVNDFFESQGFGRPVNPLHSSPQITAVIARGVLVGAAYAVAPDAVAQALLAHGTDTGTAIDVAYRFQALEAIAIDSALRGAGYGATLLASIEAHATRDHRAEYLLARVDASDDATASWYRRRGYYVCATDEHLEVNGIVVPGSHGYKDAWRALIESPSVRVRARATYPSSNASQKRRLSNPSRHD